ncbi:LCP family protein [Antrihabitans sp. YC2-6]|uniref:LCP family protein n=1 Tax=Antrihabitans sp. YC2-6 TaxID=2799498 RepID=UPI0018F53A13|nr:LCP family protein [Antrihabitans sp. YC2-6]
MLRRPKPGEPEQAWSRVPQPPVYRPPPQGRRPSPPPQYQGIQHAPPQQPERFTPPPQPHRQQRFVSAPPPPPPPRGYRQQPPPPPSRPPKPPRVRRRKSPWRWVRRALSLPLILILLIVGAVFYLDNKLNRIDALTDYVGRVGDTPGTNWLLVGSDSREDLTPEEQETLATGGDSGNGRTDTIILIHIPKSGKSTMISIPRDSYLPIPGYGEDKVNAAYAFGLEESQQDETVSKARGAQLLVETIEQATGLHIDHYGEIGFGGFAGLVDSIGGVDICVEQPIDDPKAGLKLEPGCQKLDGAQALGFVRTREGIDDLGRIRNQRLFLSALLKQATTFGTLVNPFKMWPLARDAVKSMRVDNGDHVWDIALLGWALRGDLVTTTIPIGSTQDLDVGNVVIWDDERSAEFFGALAADEQIPESLITSTP